MRDYSSIRATARAAHPANAVSSQEVDAAAVLSDWEEIKSDFDLNVVDASDEVALDFAKLSYEQGVQDERQRRRKADVARKKLPEEGWRIRSGSQAYNGDLILCRERLLERWESRVVGPFWNRRIEFGWHVVAKELYRFSNTEAADALLVATAWLEEQTNPIELMWSSKGRRG